MEVPAAGPDSIRPARKPLRGHPRVKGEPRPRTASPWKPGPSHNPPVKAKPARIRAAIRWPEPGRLEMSHPGGRGTRALPVIRLPGAAAADSSDAAGLISHAAAGVTCSGPPVARGQPGRGHRWSWPCPGASRWPRGACTVCILMHGSHIWQRPLLPPTGSSWIAVALISASVVHAARGPVAPQGKADGGSRRRVSGEPRPGRPGTAGTQGHLLDGRLPAGCLKTRGDPGQAEGCQPGIIQRARLRQAVRPPERRGGARQCVPGRRGAARCGFPACPRPATPSR